MIVWASLFSCRCLQNSRKKFNKSSGPPSRLNFSSLKRDSQEIDASADPAHPPKPQVLPSLTHTLIHTVCVLQNRGRKEKLLWALRRGVTNLHLAIFITASGRAARALGQWSSQARLNSHLPHTRTCTHTRTHAHTLVSLCNASSCGWRHQVARLPVHPSKRKPHPVGTSV